VSGFLSEGFELNNAVYVVEYGYGGIFAGGLFNASGDTPVNHLAKFNFMGRLDSTFQASSELSSTVYDVQKWGNHLYVGGAFGIAKLSLDGQMEEPFESGVIEGSVYSVDATDEGIYLGGDFVGASNHALKNIARISHAGAIDESFSLSAYPDGPVFSVLARDDSVLIGGAFVTVNGISSRRIASLNSDGSIDETFDVGTGFNNVVREVVLRGDKKIIVSGGFDKWNGQPANRIVLLDSGGRLASNRYNQLNLSGTIYTTSEIPGKLFAFGGAFEEQEDSPYNALGVVEALTSPLPPELFITYDVQNSLVRVVGESLRHYDIEFSMDLVNWVKLANEKSDSNGVVQFNIDVMRFKSQYFRATMTE
jgi:hypothetical protein